jgi:hypothetical protein
MDILPVLAIRARSERAAHNHDLLYFDLIQVTKASTQTARSACLCHFRSGVSMLSAGTSPEMMWCRCGAEHLLEMNLRQKDSGKSLTFRKSVVGQ